MNAAPDPNLKASRERLKWLSSYQGRPGYLRMHEELTGSFFMQLPELQGKVGIFNFALDPAAEISRLRSELDLPAELDLQPTSQQQTSHLSIDRGDKTIAERGRAIAWGVDPAIYGPDLDQLTPQQINNMAWQLTHEMFHAADDVLNRHSPAALAYETPKNHLRWVESFADAGRINLYARNYGSYPDYMNVLKNFIVSLDAGRPFMPMHREDIPREISELEDFIFHAAPERYDNGALLATVLLETPHERQNISYALAGWRKTLDQVTKARDSWKAARLENQRLETVTAIILSDAATYYKEKALQTLAPVAAEFESIYGQPVQALIEGLFGSPDLYRLASARRGELADRLSDAIMAALQEFLGWVESRADYLPSAGRLLAAHAFLSRKTEEIGTYTTPEMTDIQGMIRAASHYLETGDPLDKNAADMYSLAHGGMPVEQKLRLLTLFYEDPSLAPDMETLPSPRD